MVNNDPAGSLNWGHYVLYIVMYKVEGLRRVSGSYVRPKKSYPSGNASSNDEKSSYYSHSVYYVGTYGRNSM